MAGCDNPHQKRFKIVIVGDGNVGKTCLAMSYALDKFPEMYKPTIFDTMPTTIRVQDMSYPVTLWDTAGEEGFEKLRKLSYPHTDCFIICYAVNNASSFKNIKTVWIPEVRNCCPSAAILLVGTKLDVKPVDHEEIPVKSVKKLTRQTKSQGFIECSALTRENLEAVFTSAVNAVLKKQRSKSCAFL